MTKRLWIAITVLVWNVALATWRGRCELASESSDGVLRGHKLGPG